MFVTTPFQKTSPSISCFVTRAVITHGQAQVRVHSIPSPGSGLLAHLGQDPCQEAQVPPAVLSLLEAELLLPGHLIESRELSGHVSATPLVTPDPVSPLGHVTLNTPVTGHWLGRILLPALYSMDWVTRLTIIASSSHSAQAVSALG